MKVIQINAINGIKSTGRICTELADYLNNLGHEAYIAYASGPPYPKGFRIGNSLDRKIHALLSRIFGLQAYFSINSTKKLISYIDSIKPDIVHLHNLHSNYINLELLLKYLATNNIPTVITLHDCWFFTGKCTHYTADQCFKWQTECGNCPRLKKNNKSWFFDRTKKMQRDKSEWLTNIPRLAVVGVSKWITEEAEKSFLSSAKVLTFIYNWTYMEIFKPVETNELRKKMGLTNKFIIIGVASTWWLSKGLYKYIELAKILSDDMIIILVGSMSKSVNLPKNIIHIKETHDVKELVYIYSMADALVNLSMEETFGKVTAEALACGTPVVALNSTANPELVGNGCGYIAQNNTVEEVFEILETIKSKGKAFYANNCIKFAQNNFNPEDRMSDYLSLYYRIINAD